MSKRLPILERSTFTADSIRCASVLHFAGMDAVDGDRFCPSLSISPGAIDRRRPKGWIVLFDQEHCIQVDVTGCSVRRSALPFTITLRQWNESCMSSTCRQTSGFASMSCVFMPIMVDVWLLGEAIGATIHNHAAPMERIMHVLNL